MVISILFQILIWYWNMPKLCVLCYYYFSPSSTVAVEQQLSQDPERDTMKRCENRRERRGKREKERRGSQGDYYSV